ncbi:peroxiredoxin [Roseomonas genomospecies 6]|uniref:Glutathione-dependent peroxiredoxin n=1 Tax=Roseomonas genomospecies 6 TaxID=214106 RepID=A0A9W7U0L1_9PROT|nr:peroxiredoxin [Roseomonas genomospecies 6]KAA0683439.1 peroxiredoxin [Roseomonas genomospecies 6]
MTIQVGDAIPTVTLKHLTDNGMQDITTDTLFKGKTVVLFSVPGAFTPTCSAKHLPGFVQKAEDLKAKGVDDIVCLAVNDPFVMRAWGEKNGASGKVTMLPDGNATLTQALGLTMDGTGYGLGLRGQRFVLVAKDGKVTHLAVEKPGQFEVSSADAVLGVL